VRFAAPHNFWLMLVVPLMAFFLVWALSYKYRLLERFAVASMVPRLVRNAGRGRQYVKAVLWVCGAFFLALALTGPQFGTRLAMAQQKGVDVVLALDVSRSMLAEDVRPNRLARAKFQIRGLLDRLEGDRVALVVFAGKAFTQCPLTLDYGALDMLLDVAQVQSFPAQGTSVGGAISLAIRAFDPDDDKHKVVVLFTDGEDQGSGPLKAAKAAAETGARIFAVGYGSPQGELIPLRQDGQVEYHKDGEGNYVKTRLDETALQEMALASDGAYFRSSLSGGEIDQIAEEIASMDQKELGSTRFTQYEERFQLPLLLALLCFALEAILPQGRRRSQDWQGRFA
jgi:Ca-activated chloride channel homolog